MGLFDRSKRKARIISLCICAALSACPLSVPAKAEEGEKKLLSDIVSFTGISLCYIDEDGAPEHEAIVDGELIEKDARLALRYTFEIPEEKTESIEAETAYCLVVPPHLLLLDLREGSPLTVETDEGSLEFGKIYADGGRAWIKFTANTEGTGTVLSEIGGLNDAFFYLQCRRAEGPPETEKPIEGEDNLYAMKFENGKELLFSYAELEHTEAAAKIEKDGSLRDKTITWMIDYTPWQNPAEETGITPETPVELIDTIDNVMHSYVAGSIEIDGAPVTDFDSREDIPGDADTYALIEEAEDRTILHIGGRKLCAGNAPVGDPAKPVKITYGTVLREELLLPGTAGESKVSNMAELLAEKGGIFHDLGISGKYEVAVKQPVWVEKEGKTTRHSDGTGSTTDWTVTFSPNGFAFTDDNMLTLHDQLPAGSTLVEGSVKIDGSAVPSKDSGRGGDTNVSAEDSKHGGNAGVSTKRLAQSSNAGVSAGSLTQSSNSGAVIETTENNGFTVSSIEASDRPVTITYQTTVPEEMYDDGTNLGENTAWFTFRYQDKEYRTPEAKTPVGSGDGSGKPGTATLVKENGGYRAESRSIDWTVKINPHKAYLKSGTFTDDLGNTGGNCGIAGHTGGLKLPNDSADDVSVLIDGKAIEDTEKDIVKLSYDSGSQILTVTVGEVGARTVTLGYTTKVCDPCIFANNMAKERFENQISTTDMVIGKNSSEKRSVSAGSTVDVNTSVLTKRAPVYDYQSGIMKWTLEVDAAELTMTEVILTDVLPEGLTYVDGSFRTEPAVSGAGLTASAAGPGASGQKLTVNLGKVDGKTLVVFDTKVDPHKAGFNSDEDVRIVNTACMEGEADGIRFAQVSHTVEQKFYNHGLLKSSKTDNRNEWIEYEVLINPFGLSLPQTPSLVDTLDKRLQIDGDTLRFYKADVSGTSGSFGQKPAYTKIGAGEPLKIAAYDPAANSFTVQLPVSAGSRGAYVLSYRADILERQAGSYGNSVRFEGDSVRLGGMKQNSALVSGGGGGGGGVASRRVGITVTQTDSETKEPLAGVTYTLYQWDKDNNKRGLPVAQGITDASGKISFKVKPGLCYELVQTEGLSGYDAVPGWERLPEGAEKGGEGILITVGAVGSEQRLELTNEKDNTESPDDSGSTGDGNSNISGGGNSGGTGGIGNSGSTGNSGGTGSSGSSGSADSLGQFSEAGYVSSSDDLYSAVTIDIRDQSFENMTAENANPGSSESGEKSTLGKTAGGPQTGDEISLFAQIAFFIGIVSAAVLILLYALRKKCRAE